MKRKSMLAIGIISVSVVVLAGTAISAQRSSEPRAHDAKYSAALYRPSPGRIMA